METKQAIISINNYTKLHQNLFDNVQQAFKFIDDVVAKEDVYGLTITETTEEMMKLDLAGIEIFCKARYDFSNAYILIGIFSSEEDDEHLLICGEADIDKLGNVNSHSSLKDIHVWFLRSLVMMLKKIKSIEGVRFPFCKHDLENIAGAKYENEERVIQIKVEGI